MLKRNSRQHDSFFDTIYRFRGVILVVSIPLLLISFVLFLMPRSPTGSSDQFKHRKEPPNNHPRKSYAVIFDAGSSGSRVQAGRDLLKGKSALKSQLYWVTVLDGSQEGSFQWVTINYLLGNLGKKYSDTVGVVDLGGGSVQMAYAISEADAAKAPRISNEEDTYVKEMYLMGAKYHLYVHSYLRYGLLAARAEILKVVGDTSNPCILTMLPWESVLRVWDVILFEGSRVMLFRTALALMELYGPALVTTKDAGDAVTLLQSLTGSTIDSSQLVLTACMGYHNVNEARAIKSIHKKFHQEGLGSSTSVPT